MKAQQSHGHASPVPAANKKNPASHTARSPAELAREAVSGPAREEMIRLVAYELYCARGGDFGRELDDWVEAESQIDQALAKRGGGHTGTKPAGR